MLKIITLWEPWATMLAIGAKTIETRHWSTDYRGEVVIHSAKGGLTQAELYRTCAEEPFLSVLKGAGILEAGMSPRQVAAAFPRGKIIAVGNLVECHPTESEICVPGVFDERPDLDTEQEREFGDYSPGRYGLVFEDVSMLHENIPFKSRQGKLLDLDWETENLVRAVWW